MLLVDEFYRTGAEEGGDDPVVQLINNTASPDEQLLQKEKYELLRNAIEALPVFQKTILELFHQNELSLEEIAAITALPVNTIKSHLFRARKNLKATLVYYLKR